LFLFGAKANQPPAGTGEILECLEEVRRTGAIFKIENARGQEVPARLEQVSARALTLEPADPLGLKPGDATNLIYIFNDYRFSAPTWVLGAGPGGVAVALPAVVFLAERRKRARGYLNVALLGLFSPLAAAAMPEPATTYAYEPGSPAVALEHRPTTETRSARTVPMEGLIRPAAAAGPGLLDTYLQNWLQDRAPSMAGPRAGLGLGPGLPAPVSPFHARHGGLLAHGVSFHFVPCSLPGQWLSAGRSANLSFEAHVDRHNLQLGIRIK